jgi:hypothetical protein
MAKVRLMYDMARLAFESDSTRLVTLYLDSASSPAIALEGVEITEGYHNLSHHGKNESKLAQLEAIDRRHMQLLAELFTKLKAAEEEGGTLLDRTMTLYGSNFGDANKHTTDNMPVILAGGGFKHGQHLAFDQEQELPVAEPVREHDAADGDSNRRSSPPRQEPCGDWSSRAETTDHPCTSFAKPSRFSFSDSSASSSLRWSKIPIGPL